MMYPMLVKILKKIVRNWSNRMNIFKKTDKISSIPPYPNSIKKIIVSFKISYLFYLLLLIVPILSDAFLNTTMSGFSVFIISLIPLFLNRQIVKSIPEPTIQSRKRIRWKLIWNFVICMFIIVGFLTESTDDKFAKDFTLVIDAIFFITVLAWFLFWTGYFWFSKNLKEYYINTIESIDAKSSVLSASIFESSGWLKRTKFLFIGAIIFLAMTIIVCMYGFYNDNFKDSVVIFLVSLISLFTNIRLIRLLPLQGVKIPKQIKLYLGLDFLQFFLFTVIIYSFVEVEIFKDFFDWPRYVFGFRMLFNVPWLFYWLIYFSFSKKVKAYYTNENDVSYPVDLIFLSKFFIFFSIICLGVIDLGAYIEISKRSILDMIVTLAFAAIHLRILFIMRKPKKEVPSEVIFLFSIVFACYFFHHFAQYFFYSERLGEINYHLVFATFSFLWSSVWIIVFAKAKYIRTHFVE